MKKFLTWILNHLKLVLGIVTILVTATVVGLVMLNSYTSYQAYEERYNANDLDIRSRVAAEPKRMDIEDDFITYNDDGSIKETKSNYQNQLTAWAEDLKVETEQDEYLVSDSSKLNSYIDSLAEKGGKISYKMTLSAKSFVDIDFVLSSEKENVVNEEDVYGSLDILSNVDFVINGEIMEENLDIKNSGNGPEWHHLVMAGFALPEGDFTIEIRSKSGKEKNMPQVRNISILSSANAAVATEEATE